MTKQENINAKGDVAGRDVVKLTIQQPQETAALLKKLYERYKQDVETHNTTDQLIAELQSYIPDSDPGAESLDLDLERKLLEAGREDLVKQASLYKEMFRQRIERYRLVPAAQAIYAHLLGEVLTRFNTYVKPAIDQGLEPSEINKLMHEQVVEAIIQAIPETEPNCDHPSLHGMIYFLTGNCFINWQPC